MINFFSTRRLQGNIGDGSGGFSSLATDVSLSGRGSKDQKSSSWFEALAQAWGDVMDKQAADMQIRSEQIGTGQDQPSQMLLLSAEAQRFGFTATNASTACNSIGDALETLGKKSS